MNSVIPKSAIPLVALALSLWIVTGWLVLPSLIVHAKVRKIEKLQYQFKYDQSQHDAELLERISLLRDDLISAGYLERRIYELKRIR